MTSETLKCENCDKPIGLKTINNDKVEITPLSNALIEKIIIHRTESKDVEYTAILFCGACQHRTEITKTA
jgi:hypothetical protein